MPNRLRGLFQKEPLENKIPLVILKLETTLSKLANISENLRKEDNELFERCVEARFKGDTIHAMMYANECAEIRKIAILVVSGSYALEQMVLRLNTVTKLGSILIAVSPMVDVIKETKSRLVGIVPNIANNLNEVTEILSDSMTKMGTSTVKGARPLAYSDEAKKVLEEAGMVAAETIKEKFPKIPETFTNNAVREAESLTS